MKNQNFTLFKGDSPSSSKLTEYLGELSILVPTYMEKENIGALVASIWENLSQYDFEIVFIDDNSPDGTAEEIKNLSKRFDNIKLVVRNGKRGLGSAYKDGFKTANGELIVQMDADLSHNPADLPKILAALEHSDIVVGSRYTKDGKAIGWKWHRNIVSKGANFLATVFLGLKVNDSTSGFKAYKRSAFKQLVSASKFNGFEFQVEALYIAEKLGLRIAEVPVTFVNRRRGKSKLKFKDIVNFAVALVKMRLQ